MEKSIKHRKLGKFGLSAIVLVLTLFFLTNTATSQSQPCPVVEAYCKDICGNPHAIGEILCAPTAIGKETGFMLECWRPDCKTKPEWREYVLNRAEIEKARRKGLPEPTPQVKLCCDYLKDGTCVDVNGGHPGEFREGGSTFYSCTGPKSAFPGEAAMPECEKFCCGNKGPNPQAEYAEGALDEYGCCIPGCYPSMEWDNQKCTAGVGCRLCQPDESCNEQNKCEKKCDRLTRDFNPSGKGGTVCDLDKLVRSDAEPSARDFARVAGRAIELTLDDVQMDQFAREIVNQILIPNWDRIMRGEDITVPAQAQVKLIMDQAIGPINAQIGLTLATASARFHSSGDWKFNADFGLSPTYRLQLKVGTLNDKSIYIELQDVGGDAAFGIHGGNDFALLLGKKIYGVCCKGIQVTYAERDSTQFFTVDAPLGRHGGVSADARSHANMLNQVAWAIKKALTYDPLTGETHQGVKIETQGAVGPVPFGRSVGSETVTGAGIGNHGRKLGMLGVATPAESSTKGEINPEPLNFEESSEKSSLSLVPVAGLVASIANTGGDVVGNIIEMPKYDFVPRSGTACSDWSVGGKDCACKPEGGCDPSQEEDVDDSHPPNCDHCCVRGQTCCCPTTSTTTTSTTTTSTTTTTTTTTTIAPVCGTLCVQNGYKRGIEPTGGGCSVPYKAIAFDSQICCCEVGPGADITTRGKGGKWTWGARITVTKDPNSLGIGATGCRPIRLFGQDGWLCISGSAGGEDQGIMIGITR